MRETAQQFKRIIGLFPELLGVGGVQEAGRLTATALNEIAHRHGWSTEFLSLNDSSGDHSFGEGEHAVPFHGFGRAKMRFVFSGIRRARSFPRDTMGIILAAHPNLALPASWMQRESPHFKTIVMSHGIEVWKPLPGFRRRALTRANLVLAPSSDTAQKLIDVQGVAPGKVRKLAWPISPDFLRLASEPSRLLLPEKFPPGGCVILTVGRWEASERYKGADELIRAVAQLRASIPGLHLVVVGGGDDLPRLRRLATDSGAADRVCFLENLSREKLAACYAHAALFALPSTGEGFGLVFLEAMAFSKPVVGASCGGTIDLIQDGVNGLLVPPRDSEQLGQALGRLLRDESLCQALGRRGAEIIQQKYRFEVFQSELEHILGDEDLQDQTLV